MTSVGYGYSSRAADGSFVYDGYRRVASSPVKKVYKLTLTALDKHGRALPRRLRRTTALGEHRALRDLGGSKDCAGKAEGYRLDTQSARAFLGGFVTASVTSGRAASFQ